MRTKNRIATLLVAVVGLAACGGIIRIEAGRPPFEPGSPVSYWVWHDRAGWHLRTTTAGLSHRFQGVVAAADGGQILEVHPTREEWNDRIAIGSGGIAFDFTTQGGTDGFDWTVSSGCNTFDLRVDGVPAPGLVHVGREARFPEAVPFSRCR